jgi:hypothetical protein
MTSNSKPLLIWQAGSDPLSYLPVSVTLNSNVKMSPHETAGPSLPAVQALEKAQEPLRKNGEAPTSFLVKAPPLERYTNREFPDSIVGRAAPTGYRKFGNR